MRHILDFTQTKSSFFKKIDNFTASFWQQIDLTVTIFITVLAFLYLFGFRVLNVYDTNFVYAGGDFTVSYLGSVFYRLDEWRWPLLMHTNLAYPFGISVHGTDGSPLLSLIFKVFHKFFGLPADVQFVGIWTLICYILQAVFSVLIFRKAFKNKFLIVIASCFFISAPIMMMRVFAHINLICHFILLWAILLWMNNRLTMKTWIQMGIIMTLGILTCPYFLPMTAGFFGILILQQVLIEKKAKLLSAVKGILFLTAVFWFWFYLLGMLSTGQVLSSGGWRTLSLNMITLFNPMWTSSRVLTNLTPGVDVDSDNYFGLGLLILLVCMIPYSLKYCTFQSIKKNILIILLVIGFILFALSPQIKCGTMTLFEYNPGSLIEWLGSVFRYSGRFFWPVWYLLAFFIIKQLAQSFPKGVYIILPLLLAVQIWDVYPGYHLKHNLAATLYIPHDPFISEEWDRLDKKYQNIFIFANNENYRDMWRWAIRKNKNVNYGFLNRPSAETQNLVNETREAILSGVVPSKDYFYLIDKPFMKQIEAVAKVNQQVLKLKNSIRNIDGFLILEYSDAFSKQPEKFNPRTILIRNMFGDARFIQISPNRLYWDAFGKFTDYGTIIRFDDKYLDIQWDKYQAEHYEKKSDGKYHLVMKNRKGREQKR